MKNLPSAGAADKTAMQRVYSVATGKKTADRSAPQLPPVEDLLTDAGTLNVFRSYFPHFRKLKKPFKTQYSDRVNIYQYQGKYFVKDWKSTEFPDDKGYNILHVIQHYRNCDFKAALSILAGELGYATTATQSTATTPAPRPKSIIKEEPETARILVNQKQWQQATATRSSNFHAYARSLGVTDEHLEKWLVGSELRGDTLFTVFGQSNQAGEAVNLKYFKYSFTGSRDKKTQPFYLKNPRGKKYGQCLYGEHLLRDGVPTVLVESEKTAVLASFKYPQFDFLATGGANGLSRKINALKGRKGYVLVDADTAGRKLSTWKLLQQAGLDFVPVDLFRTRTDGYDLADAIRDGLQPDLLDSIHQVKANTGPDYKLYIKEYASEAAGAFMNYLKLHNKVVLSAKTGTGKTTLALDHIAPHIKGRVIILEPLTVITDAIAKSKYGEAAIIKQGATPEDIQIAINSKVTVCTYDSFSKIGDLLSDEDLLICDEIHALTSGYSMADKRPKYDYVFKALLNVKNVLCISATPQDIFKQYGFKYVEVVASKMNKLVITPVTYKGKIQHELSNLLPTLDYTAKQYIIRLNHRDLIKDIAKNFKGLKPEQVAMLTSETKEEKGGVYETIVNTKCIPEQIRLVFTTSLIDCGVDIYNENIEVIIAEHQNESLSLTDTLQFLARPRKVTQLTATVYKQERNTKAVDKHQRFSALYDFALFECKTLNSLNTRYLEAIPHRTTGDSYADTAKYCKYNQTTGQYEVRELLIHHEVEQELTRSCTAAEFFAYLEQQEHIIMQAPELLEVTKTAETEARDKAFKAAKQSLQERALKVLETEEPTEIFTALYHITKDLDLKKEIVKAGYNVMLTPSAKELQTIHEDLLNDSPAVRIFANYLKLQKRDIPQKEIPGTLRENLSPRRLGDLLNRVDTLYKIKYVETMPETVKRDVARILLHKQTIEKHLTELTSINKKIGNRVRAEVITNLINQDRPRGMLYTKDKAMQLFHILFEPDVETQEEPHPETGKKRTVKYFGIKSDNTLQCLLAVA
jgi:hypothetical protein